MRKIAKSKSETIGPVILYFDDLGLLVDIFNEACESVEIETNGYELDNINEIKDLREELITSLSIKGINPYVTLEFSPHSIRLYISEESFVQIGVLESVKNFLSIRARKWSWLTQNSFGAGASIPIAFSFIIYAFNKPDLHSIGLATLTLGIAIMWNWSNYHGTLNRHTIIYPLENRRGKRTFFQRNKDQIVLIFLTAIVTSVITFLVTKWLTNVP